MIGGRCCSLTEAKGGLTKASFSLNLIMESNSFAGCALRWLFPLPQEVCELPTFSVSMETVGQHKNSLPSAWEKKRPKKTLAGEAKCKLLDFLLA